MKVWLTTEEMDSWDVYVVDACVSIGHEYEPTIDDSTVKTPLPRPMTEYEAVCGVTLILV